MQKIFHKKIPIIISTLVIGIIAITAFIVVFTSVCNKGYCNLGSATVSNVCKSNHANKNTGACSSSCGASMNCNGRFPNSTWIIDAGRTCQWCDSNCNSNSDSAKPATFYTIDNFCWYGCKPSCGVGGWKKNCMVGQSLYYQPNYDTSNAVCYAKCTCSASGPTGCIKFQKDKTKCQDPLCTYSGWNYDSCSANPIGNYY